MTPCATCRFWHQTSHPRLAHLKEELREFGECRCHAPHVPTDTVDTLMSVAMWPVTTNDDFCGEGQRAVWTAVMRCWTSRADVTVKTEVTS